MWRRALVGTKKRSWVWYSVHIILHASIVATAAGSKLIIHSTLNSDGIVHYADNTFEQWLFYGATSTSYFMFSLGSDPQGSSRCVAKKHRIKIRLTLSTVMLLLPLIFGNEISLTAYMGIVALLSTFSTMIGKLHVIHSFVGR